MHYDDINLKCNYCSLDSRLNVEDMENGGVRRRISDILIDLAPSVKKGPDDTVRVKISGNLVDQYYIFAWLFR